MNIYNALGNACCTRAYLHGRKALDNYLRANNAACDLDTVIEATDKFGEINDANVGEIVLMSLSVGDRVVVDEGDGYCGTIGGISTTGLWLVSPDNKPHCSRYVLFDKITKLDNEEVSQIDNGVFVEEVSEHQRMADFFFSRHNN